MLKYLFVGCFAIGLVLSIPLPNRKYNEDDYSKFKTRAATKGAIDPKRQDANDWARLVEEDQQKAEQMFGDAEKKPSPPRVNENDDINVSPPNKVVQDPPNANSSPKSTKEQQLPEGDPIEHADPNHLEGVPLESDGTLNVGYKSEILLGPEHSAGHSAPDEQRELIIKIFSLVDANKDSLLDAEELTQWFLSNIRRHMDAAQTEGEAEFRRLDRNKDHKLEWHEYESAHLRAVLAANARGDVLVPAHKASAKVNVAHGENEGQDHEKGDGHEDHLAALRLRWMRADENGDDLLSLSEFQAFHHPEQHPGQIEALANQLLASFDLDNDGKIESWEFEAHTDRLPEEVRNKGPGAVMQYTNDLLAERKHQFALSDVNEDGSLDFEEVKQFLNPQNLQHAKHEAEDTIQVADVDGDNKLSLSEMLEKAGELLGPSRRLCDPAEALHDNDEL